MRSKEDVESNLGQGNLWQHFPASEPSEDFEQVANRTDGPYISFVVTARNDDHGGNLLYRMKAFVRGLLVQARKFGLSAKLSADREGAESGACPSLGQLACVATLAIMVTALDISISRHLGLLAYPPYYDGISYMVDAKRLFYHLRQSWIDPGSLRQIVSSIISSPWSALMLLSFLCLGEGEWQAYTVRFWPTFLLLVLVLWVVGRGGSCKQVKWLALAFTALLPTISAGLRASLSEYIRYGDVGLSSSNAGIQWYIADLRPDLLFAVLLLWTVVPLIECAHNLDRRIWLVSSISACLAALVKPHLLPLLVLAWAIMIVYVLLVNRQRLLSTALTGLWSLLPVAISVLVLVLVLTWEALWGKVNATWQYLTFNEFGVGRVLWLNPKGTTFIPEATYYWDFFPLHMGNEGWLLLAIGLALAFYSVRKLTPRRSGSRIIAYLGVSTALYALISAAAAKNYFVGLPYYLLLWVFSWAVISAFLGMWARRSRMVPWILLLVLCMYTGFYVIGGVYALQNWPTDMREAAHENRQVTQSIARDLRVYLRNNDTFMFAPAYGFPATLQYYMMDQNGNYPQWTSIDLEKSPEQWIRDSVSHSKAILVYEDDIEDVARFVWIHPLQQPYYRAVAEWVRQSNSSYTRVKTYHFVTDTGRLTLDLYVKMTQQAIGTTSGGVTSVIRGGYDGLLVLPNELAIPAHPTRRVVGEPMRLRGAA